MTPKPSLLLRCGDCIPFEENALPICPVHGNQPIARVLNMPAPRFRGVATGPHVKTESLPAWSGRIVGGES